jgi:hypothetical protein
LYLLKSLDIADHSPTVQLNIVRYAFAKSQSDSSYDPFCVWRHAESILADAPTDLFIQNHVAVWYHAVLNSETARSNLDAPERVSQAERASLQRFVKNYHRIRSANKLFPSQLVWGSGDAPFPVSRYFLEPGPFSGRTTVSE